MNPSRPTCFVQIALLMVLGGLLTACAHRPQRQAPPAPGTQQARHFQVSRQVSNSLDYQVFLPAGYRAGSGKKWPLIVFLHGAGERGTNIDKVTVHGPPKIVKSRPDFPFVVVSPQCPDHAFWNPDELDTLLDHILARYDTDAARVYLTGLSMGGNGSWIWSTARPERFAAVAPICGWGDPVRVWIASGPRRNALSTLPVWAFHGAKDSVVPLRDSEAMVAAFARIGNKVKLTIYPDADHNSWTAAYDDPALYDWFLSHSR